MPSRMTAIGIGLFVAGIALGVVVTAQQGPSSEIESLRKEVEALKSRQEQLEAQLGQLLAALGQGREPQQVTLSLAGAPTRGRQDAKVTMVEFSDFQCPFCGRHVRETMPQIERDYIQTGKVRYVFRDLPIESLHPQAPKAHEAVHCARDQGKYWELWQRFFANPRQLGIEDMVQHAAAVGLDTAAFRRCVESGAHAGTVRGSLEEASRLGATGTPIIFFGLTEPGSDALTATAVIRGAYPYDRFKTTIESLLAQ
jgi:protein-disulfide isomerase